MQQLCLYNEDLSFRTLEAYKTLRSNIEFSGKNIRTVSERKSYFMRESKERCRMYLLSDQKD